MIQPVAGVVPPDAPEITITTIWPSNAAYQLGRFLGRLYSIQVGVYIFTLGNLLALLSIPLALVLYLIKLLPFSGRRYRLTNRRIIVERGLSGVEDRSLDLSRFDNLEIVVLPGQGWYDAGDLVFYRGGSETFRLQGVPYPQAVRHLCRNTQQARLQVQQALAAAGQ